MKSFKPVFLCEVGEAADMQQPESIATAKSDAKTIAAVPRVASGYQAIASRLLVDRCLDATVGFSGFAPVFVTIVSGVLTWALLGIRYGTSKA